MEIIVSEKEDKKNEILYRMVEIKGDNKKVKFRTSDIKRALRFLKWHAQTYKRGLLMEILPLKKVYNIKEKKISYKFE